MNWNRMLEMAVLVFVLVAGVKLGQNLVSRV